MSANKRLLHEIKSMSRDKSLQDNGIYFYVNPDNICDIKCMLIGKEDTPYEGGFFFFQLNVDPLEYPMKPPTAKFLTTDGRIRFNPNLYCCGKVCLSILGTWSGPSWTPCHTILSVLLSIQSSVLTGEPLRNEPGHENDTMENITTYNNILLHETMRYAVTEMLYKQPRGFEKFKDVMEKHVLENYEFYVNKMNKLGSIHNGIEYKAPSPFSMLIKADYEAILNKFNLYYCENIKPLATALEESVKEDPSK